MTFFLFIFLRRFVVVVVVANNNNKFNIKVHLYFLNDYSRMM
jgi:hypothetical protein